MQLTGHLTLRPLRLAKGYLYNRAAYRPNSGEAVKREEERVGETRNHP